MKTLLSISVALLVSLLSLNVVAQANPYVGQWSIDMEKSKAASDGNTAGLMAELNINADGTFAAKFGTKGTYKVEAGKLLVTYQNSFRKDQAAVMDGEYLKFPAPAMAGKFCYMKKAK